MVGGPLALIAEFGLDQTRYFLMREVPFGNDGNYSRTSMINRINSELANNIGNLTMRTLSMINKNCQGILPTLHDKHLAKELLSFTRASSQKVSDYLHQQDFSLALEVITQLASEGNIFIDQQAPWKLAKTNLPLMGDVLAVLGEIIRHLGVLLQAFVPDAASKMLDMLAIEKNERQLSCLNTPLKTGVVLPVPEIIFPRFMEK
jgi:methionyl-tRNA synthetase